MENTLDTYVFKFDPFHALHDISRDLIVSIYWLLISVNESSADISKQTFKQTILRYIAMCIHKLSIFT
jgi:hypothetical protein